MKTFWIFILCIILYIVSIGVYGAYFYTDRLIIIFIGCGIISSLEKIYKLLKYNKQ